MKIRKAGYGNFDEIKEFLTLIFPQDSSEYYSEFLYKDQMFSPDRVFYIEDDSKIVSTLWLIPRIFRDKNCFIFSFGIANVGTHPGYRGRGYAKELMKYAISISRKEKADFVILVTEIPEYYKKFGFIDIGKVYSVIPGEKKVQDVFIRRAEEAEDLEKIVEISNLFYRKINLITPLRSFNIIKSVTEWNKFSSHFIFEDRKASWYEISITKGIKIYVYALENNDYYKVFELVFDPDLSIENVKLLLESLSSKIFLDSRKQLRIYSHKVLLDNLGLDYKNNSETVMCLKFKKVDMDRIYLPITDYF